MYVIQLLNQQIYEDHKKENNEPGNGEIKKKFPIDRGQLGQQYRLLLYKVTI